MKLEGNNHLLQKALHISVGVLLWIPLVPFLVVTLLPFLILRFSVHLLANILRPDLIPITNPIDKMVITRPSKSFPITNCCQIWKLKGKLEIKKFREHFQNVFLSSPELREKYRNLYCHYVKWGLYCFKKAAEEIDLEERIHECKLVVGEERELEQFVGKWIDTNNYGEKPNWEILLIHVQNKELDGDRDGVRLSYESVLLFKIDHGLCDGYTFIHLAEKLSGIKSPYILQDNGLGLLDKVRQ
jgi:hypothetical protein